MKIRSIHQSDDKGKAVMTSCSSNNNNDNDALCALLSAESLLLRVVCF